MSTQRKSEPTSFTLRLAPKQTLVAQGSTITPPGPTGMLVSGTTAPLSTAFVREWLKSTLMPLIGERAVAYLEANTAGEKAEEFLRLVQKYLERSARKPKH